MTLSERRIRVRATLVATMLRPVSSIEESSKVTDEVNALKEYLWLCAAPIDPNKTRGKVV